MKKIIAVLVAFAPAISFAQEIRDVNSLTIKLTNLGNTFIQILIAFAVIWIIFNIVRFLIVGADSEDKRKAARQAILWGIVGLFVILSIWGLVRILTNTFRTDNNAPRPGQSGFPVVEYPQNVP
jgi:heme/copper-type cytochrome/quinol oxidase subunit 4